MCLGIPGQVMRTWHQDGLLMGTVDFGGLHKDVCLVYVPGITPGEKRFLYRDPHGRLSDAP